MPVECLMVYPNGHAKKVANIEAGSVWLVKSFFGDQTKVVAVHCGHEDTGAAVHELDEDEVDFESLREEETMPEDLLTEDNQISYVFANTVYTKPPSIQGQVGSLVIRHALPEHALN